MAGRILGFGVWLIVSIIIVYSLVIGYLAVFDPDQIKPQQAIVFAAIAAMVGWMVSACIARRNSIKQHTMNVLTQARMNPEMLTRIRTAYQAYPSGRVVPKDDIKSKGMADPAINSSIYVMNYYEFLAAALHHGDLDHDLLKDCIRGQLCETYLKFETLIDYSREDDPRGKQNSRRYTHFQTLYTAWKDG